MVSRFFTQNCQPLVFQTLLACKLKTVWKNDFKHKHESFEIAWAQKGIAIFMLLAEI